MILENLGRSLEDVELMELGTAFISSGHRECQWGYGMNGWLHYLMVEPSIAWFDDEGDMFI